jgi:hypothetical protein
MAGPMDHYDYLSDDGNTYRIRLAKDDADRVGNTIATAAHPPLPKGMKPRRRFFRNPTSGKERSVVIGAVTNAVWTAAVGTAQALVDFAGVAGAFPITIATTAYTAAGRVGEKFRAT